MLKEDKRLVREQAKELRRVMPGSLASRLSDPAARATARRRLEALQLPDCPRPAGASVQSAGLKWSMPPADPSDGLLQKIAEGWLPLELIAMLQPYAHGRVMLDLGANIGTTAIPRAALGHFEAVYCAEPAPDNFDALCTNVRDNGLEGVVLPSKVAIGDHDGEATLYLRRRSGGHAMTPPASDGNATPCTVAMRRLDTWVEELGLDPADIGFVKSDLQGHEGDMLKGAEKLLGHKHIVWQLEFWPKGLLASGHTPSDVVELLASRFSHFVDRRGLLGRGPAPTSRIGEAIVPLTDEHGHTDLVLMNL